MPRIATAASSRSRSRHSGKSWKVWNSRRGATLRISATSSSVLSASGAGRLLHREQRSSSLEPIRDACQAQRVPGESLVARHHRLAEPLFQHADDGRSPQTGARYEYCLAVGRVGGDCCLDERLGRKPVHVGVAIELEGGAPQKPDALLLEKNAV